MTSDAFIDPRQQFPVPLGKEFESPRPIGLHPRDSQNNCSHFDTGVPGVLFLNGVLGEVAYLGLGAIPAQVRMPWHRLELAWEKDGVMKTVALQVPGKGSKELVRDLQRASAAARPACALTSVPAR